MDDAGPEEVQLDQLRIPTDWGSPPRPVGVSSSTGQEHRRPRFVKFPITWKDRLTKAIHISTYRVALHLLYRDWREGGHPLALSNAELVVEGVTRRRKWEALRELEEIGLAEIERRPRKSPIITLIKS
jgi:hypothetical protein